MGITPIAGSAEAVKVMAAHLRGQTAPKRTDIPPILLRKNG